MAGFAFIENTDLIVNDVTNQATAVHGKMQQSLMLWHGLLQSTGRDLVFDNCFWYLINFKWDQNKWRYKTGTELPGQLTATDNNNNIITIPQLEPLEARQKLGVWIAPDGNNIPKATHLRMVAAEWQKQMVKAKVNRSMAEICF